MKPTSFEKRIKRRVTARSHTFFASSAPGLKQLLKKEFKRLPIPPDSVTMAEGGVGFTGPIKVCYLANLYLGTASRITMEIAEFKAENFRTLEKKLSQVEWELYLPPNGPIQVEATTRHSRLYHTAAIEERATGIIQRHLQDDTLEKNPPLPTQRIFIRAKDDRFHISLDTSGELLHKRGITAMVGTAPLRATLARAILERTGFSGNEPLIDPMCGSGNFTLEAAMMAAGIPPGFYRRFAFEHFPCFSAPQWRHLKKTAANEFQKGKAPLIFGFDTATKLVEDLGNIVADYPFSSLVSVGQQNFFDLVPGDLTGRTGVVVLNPPYGKRLGKKSDITTQYREIGAKLARDFQGWRVGIILPDPGLTKLLPFSTDLHPLFHGGLEIHVATGIIS